MAKINALNVDASVEKLLPSDWLKKDKKMARIKQQIHTPKTQSSFSLDIATIRQRARSHMKNGAVTEGYQADRETVVQILNEVLATEIVCVLRYKRHYYMAEGLHAVSIGNEFLEHAKQEQEHADFVAQRIVQLNGEPDFNPETLMKRSHSQYAEGKSLYSMIQEDLVAERIAIASYLEIIRYLGERDPTSRTMMEEILAAEEDHADEMKTMLANLKKL